MGHTIVRIQQAGSDTRRMGASMAMAFREEPNFAYILSRRRNRVQPLSWFFGSFVAQLGLRYGEVYATSDAAGGAIWMRPQTEVSPLGAIRAGLLSMPLQFGVTGTRRSMKLEGCIEEVRQKRGLTGHWYLAALGVHPDRQGEGIGRALLKPILERVDLQGARCFLETFRERTAEFYRRLGFTVVHEDAVPDGGPTFWCMERVPQQS